MSGVLAGLFGSYPSDLGAFESIATATGTGASATIAFTSIPSTYKHLQLRFNGKSTATTTATKYVIRVTLNSGIFTYTQHNVRGDGSTVSASGTANATFTDSVATVIPNSGTGYANLHGVGIIDVLDYSLTTKNKTMRMFLGADVNTSGSGAISLNSGLFASTQAVNRIAVTLPTGFWTTTSTFALYGIKG